MTQIQYILWAFLAGVAVAAVYTYYTKKILGGFVRKLMQADAFYPDEGLTLEELGYSGNPFVKYALRKGTSFSETILNDNGRYYIPEEKIDKAENKYKDDSMTVYVVLLVFFALAVIGLIVSIALPELSSLFQNAFN